MRSRRFFTRASKVWKRRKRVASQPIAIRYGGFAQLLQASFNVTKIDHSRPGDGDPNTTGTAHDKEQRNIESEEEYTQRQENNTSDQLRTSNEKAPNSLLNINHNIATAEILS
jgi:hypothetical protein